MTWKSKEDGDQCLNTESSYTTSDPKKCAGQFAKAFHNKVEKLRSQSEPKNKPSFNIETIPRPIMNTSFKFTTLEKEMKSTKPKILEAQE